MANNIGDFKNFHRLLCERFSYPHDEELWWRDQISLIEHIAAERDALKAELDELKLELSGCENVKADLARMLNCEDEPRWKWIVLEVSTLITELEAARKQDPLGFRIVKMSDIVKIHECLPTDTKAIPGVEFNYPQDLANVALRRIREAVMSMSSSQVPAQQPGQ